VDSTGLKERALGEQLGLMPDISVSRKAWLTRLPCLPWNSSPQTLEALDISSPRGPCKIPVLQGFCLSKYGNRYDRRLLRGAMSGTWVVTVSLAANAVSRSFVLNVRSAPCCGRSELRDIGRLLAEGEVVARLTGTEAVFHIPGSRNVKLLLEGFRDSMKTIPGSGLELLSRN
jgi:hypothetical protein